MFVWSIDDMFIYFIRYHIAIVSGDYVSYLLKFLTSEDLAAGIGRVAQKYLQMTRCGGKSSG